MYDNNNFDDDNSNQPSDNSNNEYRFSKDEIPHRSYMDANYIPRNEEPSAPKSYYTPPVKPPKREKGMKQGLSFAKLISLCIVCALLGGIGGGALVASQLPENNYYTDYKGNVLNRSYTDQTDQTEKNTEKGANPVVSGETLTGSQIYSLGCAQAVGISTDITYTNYFGMQSKSAVSGSGFIVTSDGYIVTNYHVIQKAYQEGYKISVILYNGDKYNAKIVGVEESSDIAVLKIDATGLTPATLGDSDSLQVGEPVYAIGNPLGELSFSMTSGMISALDRDITTQDPNTRETITNNMFQIDAAVNEGNSGGPAYNAKGEVIGIVTAKYASTGVEGLGFAIPINDVADIVNQLITQGYVSDKAKLGIGVSTVSSAAAQYYNMVEGAFVFEIEAGSCAERDGIKVGDIITAVNDKQIKSVSEFQSEKKNYKAGDTITLKIYRDGKYINLDVTLDEDVPANAVNKSER